jgi:hypothetical protein
MTVIPPRHPPIYRRPTTTSPCPRAPSTIIRQHQLPSRWPNCDPLRNSCTIPCCNSFYLPLPYRTDSASHRSSKSHLESNNHPICSRTICSSKEQHSRLYFKNYILHLRHPIGTLTISEFDSSSSRGLDSRICIPERSSACHIMARTSLGRRTKEQETQRRGLAKEIRRRGERTGIGW